MAPGPIVIDQPSDDAKETEVHGQSNERKNPRHKSDQCCRQRPRDAGADRHQECNERHAAGNWVQNHDLGQAIGSASFDARVRCGVDHGHLTGGFISDMATSTPSMSIPKIPFHQARYVLWRSIIYGIRLPSIENAVTKGAEADAGVFRGGSVGETHAKKADVVDDRSRYGDDEQQNRRHEEEKHSDPRPRR